MSQGNVIYKFKKKDQPDELIIKIKKNCPKYRRQHINSSITEKNNSNHKLRKNNTLTTSYLLNKLISRKLTDKKLTNTLKKDNFFIREKQSEKQLPSSKHIAKKVNCLKSKNTKKNNYARTPIGNKVIRSNHYSTILLTKQINISLSKTNILNDNQEKKFTHLSKNKKKIISPPERNPTIINSFCNIEINKNMNHTRNKLNKVKNNCFAHSNDNIIKRDSKIDINSKSRKTNYENLVSYNTKNKSCINGMTSGSNIRKERKKIDILNRKIQGDKIISEIFKYAPKYTLKIAEEKQKKLKTSQSQQNYKDYSINKNGTVDCFDDFGGYYSFITNSIPTFLNKKNYIVGNSNKLKNNSKEKYELNCNGYDYNYKNIGDVFLKSNRTSINLRYTFKKKNKTQNTNLDIYDNTENKKYTNRQYESCSTYSKKKFRSLSKERNRIKLLKQNECPKDPDYIKLNKKLSDVILEFQKLNK